MSSARYGQFNTKFTTRGSVVAIFGGRHTVCDAQSGHCAAGSIWPQPVSRAFCMVLPPFDAHLLCVIPHSQPLILPLALANIHHPSLKVKSYIYCITSSLTHDLTYLLNCPLLLESLLLLLVLWVESCRDFEWFVQPYFLPFIFSTRFVKSQDFFKNAYITLLQKQLNKK